MLFKRLFLLWLFVFLNISALIFVSKVAFRSCKHSTAFRWSKTFEIVCFCGNKRFLFILILTKFIISSLKFVIPLEFISTLLLLVERRFFGEVARLLIIKFSIIIAILLILLERSLSVGLRFRLNCLYLLFHHFNFFFFRFFNLFLLFVLCF